MSLPPEEALKKIDDYLEEIGRLKGLNYNAAEEDLYKLRNKIKGFIVAAFENPEKRCDELVYFSYSSDENKNYMGRIKTIENCLISFKEEIELSKLVTPIESPKPVSNSKIDKILKLSEEKEAEARRRGAVTETKTLGGAIEIITELRNQLKEKDTVTKELKQIKEDIADIKRMLEEK